MSARKLPNIPAPSATYAIRPRMPCHAVHASPIALLQGSGWLCRFVDTACDAAAAAALKGATACEFFATPVVIGRTGVVKNLGLGNLSEYVRSPVKTDTPRSLWVGEAPVAGFGTFLLATALRVRNAAKCRNEGLPSWQEKKKLQEAIAELKPAIKEGIDFVRAGVSKL